MINSIKKVFYLIEKDIKIEFRRKQMIISMLIFSMSIVILFNFFIGQNNTSSFSGILWLAILLSSALNFNHSYSAEFIDEAIYGLGIFNRSLILISKIISNFIFNFINGVLIIIIAAGFSGFDISHLFNLSLLLAVISLGMSVMGSFWAVACWKTDNREIIMPLLYILLVLPLLIMAHNGVLMIIDKIKLIEIMRPMLIVDAIYLALAVLLFDFIWEE